MRCITVLGIACLEHLLQLAARIAHLQQRPLGIVSQPPEQLVGRGAQIQHRTSLTHQRTVLGPQHRAPPGGQHARAALFHQPAQHRCLQIPEGLLALGLEKSPDRHADLFLDGLVGVDEGQRKAPGHMSARRGLARAGHADENDHNVRLTMHEDRWTGRVGILERRLRPEQRPRARTTFVPSHAPETKRSPPHRKRGRFPGPFLWSHVLSVSHCIAARELTILGEMKTSSSVFLVDLVVFLKRLPRIGMSPSSGTLVTSLLLVMV